MQKITRAAVTFVRKMNATQKQDLFSNGGQTVKRGCPPFALALLATLCLSAPLRADDQVPFKGAFNLIILSATQVDPTPVRLDIAVTVIASQLGKAHGPAFATLDLTDLSYVGGATWAAANRDAVSLTFAGQFIPMGLSAPPSNSFPRPRRARSTIRLKGAGMFKGRLLHQSRRANR